jgi:mono/diheme cytochrome c family protein
VSRKSVAREVAIILATLVVVCLLAAQFPASAQEKTNPVKPSSESLAKGKKLYNIDCAMCHNENGDGKNDMDMKNVPDITTAEAQKATDGQWFQDIKDGKGDMPPEAARVKSDDEIWNLVNYCRTLAKK